jgi:signal transduction histidine kinase
LNRIEQSYSTTTTGTPNSILQIAISVIDTGIGIPSEFLAKLGTPFFTVQHDNTGTGLGLSICKRILQAMGSSLKIESKVLKVSDE